MSLFKSYFAIPHLTIKDCYRLPPILKLFWYPVLFVIYLIWIPIRFLIWLFLPKKKRDIYSEMPAELK